MRKVWIEGNFLIVSVLRTALAVMFTLSMVRAAIADAVTVPPVPLELQAPAGSEAYFAGHAIGTQVYICMKSGWSFLGPQATLFDGNNQQVTTHFLSPNPLESGTARPTWQHSGDTSAVWAKANASSLDPAYVAPGAIPWLLLEVVGAQSGTTGEAGLSETIFIHRLNTTGGTAPATGCSKSKDIGKKAFVPYTADYFFYKSSN